MKEEQDTFYGEKEIFRKEKRRYYERRKCDIIKEEIWACCNCSNYLKDKTKGSKCFMYKKFPIRVCST